MRTLVADKKPTKSTGADRKQDLKVEIGETTDGESTVTVTVVGASGDLAKKKIFPALFALFYEGCLPKVNIISVVSMCILSDMLDCDDSS